MVSVSIKNSKCYDSNDCCDGYTCVRARRLKDKFSKKLHPNCKRYVNGNKKYSGCCKQKGSYSPFSFKRYKLPDKKMSTGDFGFRQNNDNKIQFLYPSEAKRNALTKKNAQLCDEPQSRRSPTSVRSPSPTTTINLSRRSPSPTTTRSPSPTTRSLSRRSPTIRGRIKTRMARFFQTKRSRQRAAIDKIYSGLENTNEEEKMLRLEGNKGERNRIFGRLTLENEDNKFERCVNISGENKGCNDPKYSICAKARRRFQKSLKRKHSEKPQFENCLTPPKESGEIKIHRNRGCCISKKEYGLGIQYKRLKNKKNFLKI